MNKNIQKAVADSLNHLGWSPDIPDENGKMLFSFDCHEVIIITEFVEKAIDRKLLLESLISGHIESMKPLLDEWSELK